MKESLNLFLQYKKDLGETIQLCETLVTEKVSFIPLIFIWNLTQVSCSVVQPDLVYSTVCSWQMLLCCMFSAGNLRGAVRPRHTGVPYLEGRESHPIAR